MKNLLTSFCFSYLSTYAFTGLIILNSAAANADVRGDISSLAGDIQRNASSSVLGESELQFIRDQLAGISSRIGGGSAGGDLVCLRKADDWGQAYWNLVTINNQQNVTPFRYGTQEMCREDYNSFNEGVLCGRFTDDWGQTYFKIVVPGTNLSGSTRFGSSSACAPLTQGARGGLFCDQANDDWGQSFWRLRRTGDLQPILGYDRRYVPVNECLDVVQSNRRGLICLQQVDDWGQKYWTINNIGDGSRLGNSRYQTLPACTVDLP